MPPGSQLVIITVLMVVGSSFVFALGRFLMQTIVRPVLDLRQAISEIEAALSRHADLVTRPAIHSGDDLSDTDRRMTAQQELRELAARLSRSGYAELTARLSGGADLAIWEYDLAARCGLIPARSRVQAAQRALLELGDSLFSEPKNRLLREIWSVLQVSGP
jgi:hypothetical protein